MQGDTPLPITPKPMNHLTNRIAGLSPAKRALLEMRLKSSLDGWQGEAIPRRANSAPPPLSFAQQRLWFLDRLEPNNTAYNISGALRITGALQVGALERGLNEIVRRHEALRTTFVTYDGQPVQVISDLASVALKVVELNELPEAECHAQALRLAAEEARRPFDLARGPLLRVTLLRLSREEHLLLLAMHHIVSDGWSMDVLLRELGTLYEAFSQGKPSPLSELPIQYADYAVWQRQWLQGEVLDSQLGYWRKQLAGAPSVLELPTDHPRPAIQSFQGARQSLRLSKKLTEALKELSRQQGATLFMTLLAAFKTLLYRYTGQDDIVVGSPIAGRNRAQIEGLIGFFINTLVLRTDLSGNPTFHELLGRVRETALGAYAHQDLPFEKLVEELQPQRDLSRTPLFQVFFNMINAGDGGMPELPGLTGEWLKIHEPASKFDLTLYATERNGVLGFSLVYNPDLFEAATISRLLGHYHTLLETVAADSRQPISSIPLLTEAERNQFSVRRNRVAPTNPFIEFKREDIEQSLPARFEQIAKAYPRQTAVKTGRVQWSYTQLNRAADRIARTALRSYGPGEERIALLFDHDAPMIAAILGTLKAGKTYVPLDPAHPKERLAYVLEDSQARAIITNNRNVALAKMLINGGLRLINVDDTHDTAPSDTPNIPISPDRPAYILYTSGSTGQPKGVIQSHRNVLHHIRNYTNNLHLNSEDGLTLLSSYGFDAAVMDIFGALLNGAALHPMDLKEEDRSALLARMVEEKVTIYHSTPTVYRYLMGSLTGKEDLSAIRFVVLGGEEVRKEDVDLFQRRFSSKAIFVNGLGPTESTLALQYLIDHETRISGSTVPVGYPVAATEVLLLNEAGEDAEIYGEIGIRSAHVALGYWRKPELTQAAFLPDPQGGAERIYRTGDMGRLLPDGSISFLGRKDFQVKIRGFRIELGEIETALVQHPSVREAVVVGREEVENPKSEIQNPKSPGKRLAAYVVSQRKPAPTSSDLRSFLRQKLPDYMVPSAFVFLDALPLTRNGKVDRQALPTPDPIGPELEKTFVAPRDALELQLTKIWEKLLDIKRVGVTHNFFDLGGHSLLAVRLFAEIERITGKQLPLATLFQAPTVEQLAGVLRQEKWQAPWSSLVAIQPGGSKPPFFGVHAHEGNILFYRDLARRLGPDQPFYGLQALGLDGSQPLHTSVEEMAAHYVKEIRALQPEGPYFLGGYCFGGVLAFEMARQLHAQGERVALLALFDAYAPGSLRLSPRSISFSDRLRYLSRKVRLHLHNLSLLRPKEQIDYIKGRVKRIAYWLYTGAGLPFRRSRREILDAMSQASRSYRPQLYQDRVTLFRGGRELAGHDHDPQLGWGRLAAGGVEIHRIPSYDGTLFLEPHVRLLAEELARLLAAQADQQTDSASRLLVSENGEGR